MESIILQEQMLEAAKKPLSENAMPINVKFNSQSKDILWPNGTKLRIFKEKVAKEYDIKKNTRFFFAHANGQRITTNIRKENEIYIELQRGERTRRGKENSGGKGEMGVKENSKSLKRPAVHSMEEIPAKRAMLGLLSILDAYQN